MQKSSVAQTCFYGLSPEEWTGFSSFTVFLFITVFICYESSFEYSSGFPVGFVMEHDPVNQFLAW